MDVLWKAAIIVGKLILNVWLLFLIVSVRFNLFYTYLIYFKNISDALEKALMVIVANTFINIIILKLVLVMLLLNQQKYVFK